MEPQPQQPRFLLSAPSTRPGTYCTVRPFPSPSCPGHDRHREQRVLITHRVAWVSDRSMIHKCPDSLVTCLASHSAAHATSASLKCIVRPKRGEFPQMLQVHSSLATGRAPAKSQQLIPRGKAQAPVLNRIFSNSFKSSPLKALCSHPSS